MRKSSKKGRDEVKEKGGGRTACQRSELNDSFTHVKESVIIQHTSLGKITSILADATLLTECSCHIIPLRLRDCERFEAALGSDNKIGIKFHLLKYGLHQM